MKNMVKIAFTLSSLAFASQAFAIECGGLNLQFLGSNSQPHCSPEEAAAADRARMNRYGANTGTVFVQRAPVYVQERVQFVPVTGQPGHFATGGNVYRCPALVRYAGLFFGAVLGNAIGKEITISGGTMSAGGAVLGAVAGQDIACELVQPNVASVGTLANQGGVVGTARQCQAGLSWKVLDWPGHPQHGKANCLPSDDVLAQQRATSQPAASGERVCTTAGTTWKKLDWPGHHQHGVFACLPSDEKIAEQKAASQKAP